MINLHNLPNALKGEKPVLFLRRHWIEVLSIFFYFSVLMAIPLLFFAFMYFTDSAMLSSESLRPFLITGGSLYLLFVLVIFFTQFTDYYLDTWIVTTERIIDIEQHGLFSRLVSELHLNEIQDVTSETKGFLETFLTYGDVHIQTAGTQQRFNFKNVNNPESVKRVIIHLIQEDKLRHPINEPASPLPAHIEPPPAS